MWKILTNLHEKLNRGDYNWRGEGSQPTDNEADGGSEEASSNTHMASRDQELMKALDSLDISNEPALLHEMERRLARGELEIPLWEPWWLGSELASLKLTDQGTPLVTECDTEESAAESFSYKRKAPPLPKVPLPKLMTLSSKPPSGSLAFYLLDIIYSYCLVMRLFNGDCSVDYIDAANVVMVSSVVLRSREIVECRDVTTILCRSASLVSGSAAGRAEVPRSIAVGLMSDVGKIVSLGRSGVLAAIMDLRQILENAKLLRSNIAKSISKAILKLVYYLSYANELPDETYCDLALEVEDCFRRQQQTVLHVE